MNRCYKCGFWDSDREGCTCPSYEMWYACPIEAEKPENKKELEKYAEWASRRGGGRVMQIVIDMPEDAYNYIKANGARIPYYKLSDAIKNGTPLPKGHGKLKDVEDIALIDEQFYVPSDYYVAVGAIENAPTIIEADRAESEEK